ncbi:ATP-dependent DNA helicase recG C-terminal [Corynebacterium mustelae]|uniref:ATP-dependent DNA helicase recG C-terminal n=1 Tax=Corynebacterium mustelae TaxID=571915 RepID=A0A0G3H596_9CORY|nr:ATP-binding protein [Corynebacterium mustelae]AKK06277.1 ATP-dependent DNA helicase recG C-terminal [Corynebacterium mustelae]
MYQRGKASETVIDYELLPASDQELKFSVLEEEFVEKHSIKELSPDILKTLQLLSPDGVYNKAAELLADTNDFLGIDMARFGSTINEIHGRYDLTGVSVLKQFHEALSIFTQNYVYEKIEGATRETVETIPKEAFRESITNALVHRAWDVRAPIKVSMHPDKIVVTSPGRLPPGISPHDYANGHFSLLRNPILGMVFFRLGYIEKFGTGIARIKHLYQASVVQPAFDIYDSSITITLPILSDEHSLNQHHVKVLAALDNATPRSRSEIATVAAVSRAITIRALNELIELGSVKKVGSGPQTKYMRNN